MYVCISPKLNLKFLVLSIISKVTFYILGHDHICPFAPGNKEKKATFTTVFSNNF